MHKDEMILISVDDHVVEPPDMFKNHLSKKYLDEAPRLVHNPDGSDTWQFRDVVIPNVALNAVAGRPKEEYGLEPQGLDEI
ncbi:MAG TPA: amidohydrolase, partial [Mycobacterium sp.]|nr:amidohydrolase [Mycobacterium sp.]